MTPWRRRVRARLRTDGRRLAVRSGQLTARWRAEPAFLVVGAQRAGTTSLFRALMAHPNILRANFHKGVNYFDLNYSRGWSWYLAHFPLQTTSRRHAPPGFGEARVFEASGYYMFHPHAAGRIAERLPEVKIVALLRDPVERAYSAYKHEFARGFETETFRRALDIEDGRIEPELARMLADPTYHSETYRHQAYRRRGQYAEQLQRFADALGADRLFLMESERFFATPAPEYTRLLQFLELPVRMPATFDQFNARPGTPMSAQLRHRLEDHFFLHDEALSRMLGRMPTWRS